MAGLTKDEKIIKANPDASAYELLQLGISEKKYNELLEKESTEATAPRQKVAPVVVEATKVEPKVTVVEAPRAAPKLTQVTAAQVTGKTYLVNKQTGKRTPMTAESIRRMVNKYPNIYEQG